MRYYFLGVDGGGSKTAFLLTDETGCALASYELGGSSLPHIGEENFVSVLRGGVESCVKKAGIEIPDISRSVFGAPCLGESAEYDARIIALINGIMGGTNVSVHNDSVVAHAGSLALMHGVHILAGTGAIIFGKNADGAAARANGWHEQFSDEGSGYWLGLATLACFAKQSDNRLDRGPLYGLVRERFDLNDDIEIVTIYDDKLKGRRDRVARLQEILKQAADLGDISAIELYKRAAYELFLSVRGVCRTLGLNASGEVLCSYSGGVFNVGKYLLDPLGEYVKEIDARITPPVLDPVRGAVLLAAKEEKSVDLGAFTNNLKAWKTV